MSKSGQRPIIVVRKRHGDHGGGHHGGAWKVAYADFVTAMMAFFMVMWILGMDQNLKESIEGYFSNPVGYKKGYSGGASPLSSGQSPVRASAAGFPLMSKRAEEEQQFDSAGSRIKEKLGELEGNGLEALAARVEIVQTTEGLRIELVEDTTGRLFFNIASAVPREELNTILVLIGRELAPLVNPVIVEGHTDALRYGGRYTNWDLSTERANAARRTLETAGVSERRIVGVRGFADRQPRVPGNPLDPRNRRITILLPFTTPASGTAVAN
jgi:chemotaxis protein MotB